MKAAARSCCEILRALARDLFIRELWPFWIVLTGAVVLLVWRL